MTSHIPAWLRKNPTFRNVKWFSLLKMTSPTRRENIPEKRKNGQLVLKMIHPGGGKNPGMSFFLGNKTKQQHKQGKQTNGTYGCR
jgi:hypothetical protein